MKKSYSKFNILGAKLNGNMYKGFIDYFSNNKKVVELTISYYDYIRGNIFIDDTREAYQDVPIMFNVSALIYVLYDDFMSEIKKGIPHKDIATYLLQGKKRHLEKVKKEKRIMKQVSKNLLSFESEFEEEPEEDEKVVDIYIKMRQAEILRGEILLHDLDMYMNAVEITFEELLQIVYLNFIAEVKEKGNTHQIQKALVRKLNS
ncbi:hypothetical protein [Bacillus sp. JJ722]|uniref:hypothetical protein n=1 Tax=Bacillus sp. JJ722 TaxID=3122973 RepID=UPI002FFD7B9E